MACECIPNLKKAFREDIASASTNYPRMCKQKWRYTSMKGFPFEYVNETLGSTKKIHSILEAEFFEEPLMDSIMECDYEIYVRDLIAQSWEHRLRVEKNKIFWESLYDSDVSSRDPAVQVEQHEEEQQQEEEEQHEDEQQHQDEQQQQEDNHTARVDASLEEKLTRAMQAGFRRINKRIDVLDRRLKDVEHSVKIIRGGGHDSEAEDNFRGNSYDFGGGDDRGEEEEATASPTSPLAAPPAAPPVASPAAPPAASPTAPALASQVPTSPAAEEDAPVGGKMLREEKQRLKRQDAEEQRLKRQAEEEQHLKRQAEEEQLLKRQAEEEHRLKRQDAEEQRSKRQQMPSKYIQTPYTM